MKQCPVCRVVYADDLQSFCLADGTMLLSIADEEETRVISSGRKQVNIHPPAETMPAFTAPPVISHPSAPTAAQSPNSSLVAVLAGLLAIVVLIFAGFVAFTFLKSDDGKNTNVTKNSPTPTATPARDDETNKLKEQVANLEKKIEGQKTPKNATPVPTVTTKTETRKTAQVNSPRDGFLALRSEPHAETGYRVTKIPHGTAVYVLSCQSYSSSVGSRTGRWCQVDHEGQTGWVFDAFLDY